MGRGLFLQLLPSCFFGSVIGDSLAHDTLGIGESGLGLLESSLELGLLRGDRGKLSLQVESLGFERCEALVVCTL